MMKNYYLRLRIAIVLVLVGFVALQLSAANTTTTVSQVSTTVSLTTDVDYVITGTTPFTTNGIVDIQNTEHAVLIFDAVKPSAVLNLLASHVKIAGEKAVNTKNCQVKLYNRGTIILPYGDDIKPLTVYSEQKFEGESSNDFTIGHNGNGYMKSLPASWNNRIRSFKLKRGYMVTFSTRPNGRGYSRCFVAAYEDRQLAICPAILDGFISSYRIFKWYDASKAGVANDTRKEACDALNVQSCYSFSLGEDRGIDCECVPHHIYEDWPSASACGKVTYSPNLKTNNEPGNSADDHPQTVSVILANWENLMATGMRLCSPSSHDGSLAHLRAFMDSIDARGWRCDILDIHSYWDKGSFGNLAGWYNSYKRPIWVSEWVWGASWNNNGIFNTGAYNRDNPGDKEYQANKSAVAEICGNMNNWNYVERYFYWNSEANCSKLYRDGKLTPAGEWYASQKPGLGYKKELEYTPKDPPMTAPSSMKVKYDKVAMTAVISWYDNNGEWNKSMALERSVDGGTTWTELYVPTQNEAPKSYSYTDKDSRDGYRYRVHIVDLNDKNLYSAVGVSVLSDATTGDGVTIDGEIKYIGGNIIVNGDFEMGVYGWTNGQGYALGAPNFELMSLGSSDAGHHLFSWTNQAGSSSAGALRTTFDVEPQAKYYFSVMLKNTGGVSQTVLAGNSIVYTTQKAEDWTLQAGSFGVGDNNTVIVNFRSLDKARMDKFILCKLFDTPEEAIADGVKQAIMRAQAFIKYNNIQPGINSELQAVIEAATGNDRETLEIVEDALSAALDAYNQLPTLMSLTARANKLIALNLPVATQLKELVEQGSAIAHAADVSPLIAQMEETMDGMAFTSVSTIKNPSFSSTDGWTKSGTYTSGDQRKNEVLGKTCWNAWWSVSKASAGDKTLAVEQTLSDLPEGYYYLTCAATTEHYCLSDQHAFLKKGTEKVVSPALTYDRFDYPNIANDDAWETLATDLIYVSAGEALTLGFESSKQGAVDGACSKNDNREGWWCATDFKLYYMPVYTRVADAEGPQWGTICLPQKVTPGDGMKLYEVAGGLTEGDKRYVCLSPLESQAAGYPAVFFANSQKAMFFTEGEAVKIPKEGANGLYGDFYPTYIYRSDEGAIGTIVMENNNWRELTEADYASGPYIVPKNQASLYTFADLTPLQSWDGVKMEVNGTGIVDSIQKLPVSEADGKVEIFTLDGRRARGNARGLLLIRKNGKVHKILTR